MAKFPAALKPAARSAYREVLRAARITFQALRATFSSPTLTPPPSASSSSAIPISEESVGVDEIVKRITEWKELARFLKKNIVQGVKGDDGAWKLRVTEHTELGDNASIKNPPKLPTTPFPNRNRRKCSDAATAS
ncbi:hypothetical protein I315_00447 [Cryptococcus gattii Ru294]|nr:hypothetical protein I315_00447 [Cryptococcus gattii Ru294]